MVQAMPNLPVYNPLDDWFVQVVHGFTLAGTIVSAMSMFFLLLTFKVGI